MNPRYTLKLNSDFRRLYSKGKSSVTPYFVLYVRKNNHSVNRIGYTVSSKIGHAVVRNRVKRRLREVFHNYSTSLKQGYDFVVVARHKSVEAPFTKLEKSFADACRDLDVLI